MLSEPGRLDFSDKMVLVVGGSSGIGRGIARAFQACGADVAVWGTRASIGDYDSPEELDGIDYAQVDATDERQVRVSLTAKGRDLKARAADARHEVACATGLPPAEIDALKEQSERLREALHAQADQAR